MTEANLLLIAVEDLTAPRKVTTVIKDEDDLWIGVHTEQHPSLLELLLNGAGIPARGKSTDVKIPIDAEALELWGQIHDLTRVWCRCLKVVFDHDDLPRTVARWYLAHANAVRSGRVSAEIDQDVTRMVEGWVRMIMGKYNPIEKHEWLDACVAQVMGVNNEGEMETATCGARRIILNGLEEFAIQLNVTTRTASCRACGTVWAGENRLSELRFWTNLAAMDRAGLPIDQAALSILATPVK